MMFALMQVAISTFQTLYFRAYPSLTICYVCRCNADNIVCFQILNTFVAANAVPQKPSDAKEIVLSRAYPCGGCGAYYWGYEKCRRTWYGVYCDVNPKRYGGCIVYVYQKSHWRWCRAEGDRGARCKCYHDSTNNRVNCYSP